MSLKAHYVKHSQKPAEHRGERSLFIFKEMASFYIHITRLYKPHPSMTPTWEPAVNPAFPSPGSGFLPQVTSGAAFTFGLLYRTNCPRNLHLNSTANGLLILKGFLRFYKPFLFHAG